MKNNLLFILAAVCVLSAASCKKKVETCKLGKTYASDGNTTPNPNVFSYYEDGRLKTVLYTNRTKDSLSYSADTLYIRTRDNADSTIALFTGVLDSRGNVTSATKVFVDYAGNVISTESYLLEYNSEGQLSKKTVTSGGTSTVLNINYEGTNSKSGTLYIGPNLDRQFFFFHNTVENKTGIDDLNSVLTPYFGEPSTHLLDSAYIITTTDSIRVQYAHTLDDNEYVSKTIQTFLTDQADTKYFTYQYFDCEK
jgi:hypothetical protein